MSLDAEARPLPLDTAGVPGQVVRSRAVYRFRLRYVTHHPSSHYGIGVFLDAKGEVFDGWMLRYLHHTIGAYLHTDDPERCQAALGLATEEWVAAAIRLVT